MEQTLDEIWFQLNKFRIPYHQICRFYTIFSLPVFSSRLCIYHHCGLFCRRTHPTPPHPSWRLIKRYVKNDQRATHVIRPVLRDWLKTSAIHARPPVPFIEENCKISPVCRCVTAKKVCICKFPSLCQKILLHEESFARHARVRMTIS